MGYPVLHFSTRETKFVQMGEPRSGTSLINSPVVREPPLKRVKMCLVVRLTQSPLFPFSLPHPTCVSVGSQTPTPTFAQPVSSPDYPMPVSSPTPVMAVPECINDLPDIHWAQKSGVSGRICESAMQCNLSFLQFLTAESLADFRS